MARFNLTTSSADERRFADFAYAQGWNLALHTPPLARPAPVEESWQQDLRSISLVVWMVQPDAEAGVELVDDRLAAREEFEQSFMRGYGECLQLLCCWSCGAPRIEEIGQHFCSQLCRNTWRDAHDGGEWAASLLCSNCRGSVDYPDQNFCSVLCEAEWIAARAAL